MTTAIANSIAAASRQGYFDLGWEKDDFTIHLSGFGRRQRLGRHRPDADRDAAGQSRAASSPFRKTMQNQAELVQLTSTYRPSRRHPAQRRRLLPALHQHLIDGNTTDVTPCANDAAFFCLEGAISIPPTRCTIRTATRCRPAPYRSRATDAYGETDFTTTDTNTVGAGLQAKFTNPLWNHRNNFVVGATVDHSMTNYTAEGELGALPPSLDVTGSDVIIDQGRARPRRRRSSSRSTSTAPTPITAFYATDAFDVTPRLAATFERPLQFRRDRPCRPNWRARRRSTARTTYAHFNPGAGLTYKLADNVTLYGGWSEANRAPTPAELICADPANPACSTPSLSPIRR